MKPDKPCELETAGVDPDGFHEEEGGPVLGSDSGIVPDQLLDGGFGASKSGQNHDVPSDRPSGVYKRATKAPRDIRVVVPKPGADWVVQGPDGEALCVSVREVGCFLIRPDGFNRHRVFNRLTGFQHVTYGTEADVDIEYLRQAESWKQKLSPVKKHGSGWRQTNFQKTQS